MMKRVGTGLFTFRMALAAGLIALALFLPALAKGGEKRLALVIGNSDYEHVPNLSNPVNDSKDLAAALRRIGFEVTSGQNMDFRQMRLALRDFAEQAAQADIVLIFFAGHGIEINNTNYLIPINAELRSDRDIEFEAIRLDAILAAISDAPGLKIVLLDACRNNPFLSKMTRSTATRSIGQGLGRINPGGVLVGYAARGGTLALDGKGRNSPYARAILRYIEQPGLELGKLFRKVRDSVYEETGGYQEPFTYGSLPGRDIYLVPPVQAAAITENQAPQKITPIEAQLVEVFAKAENRPNLKKWDDFLRNYGNYEDNALVKLAITRREALAESQEAKKRMANREPWLKPEKLSRGAFELTREETMQLQKSLMYAGFDVGVIDGNLGPKSLGAVSAARAHYGLYASVMIDSSLLRALPNPVQIEGLQSKEARRYTLEEIPFDLEPRLKRALTTFASKELVFGYFEGRLYITLMDSLGGWHRASDLARKAGGHLATIGSAAENGFIYNLFSQDKRFIVEVGGDLFGPAFGLYQADRSREPAGGWIWITGEPLPYRNWSPGNPDNYQQRQHYARFYLKRSMRGLRSGPIYWDDTSESWSNWGLGYVLEFE